ncbi:MAG: hypothetical protein J0M12_08660 [Deltaproteobacteria bacterium]|nr:hypothetical protein [Deltaproteobacteria bacterium]
MWFLKAFALFGLFWLFFRLRTASRYGERSACIVSLVWGSMVLFVSITLKGISLAALSAAGIQIAIATAVFYAVAFLDNTAVGLGAWPLGFLVILLFG